MVEADVGLREKWGAALHKNKSSGWQSLQQIHAEAAGQPEPFDMHNFGFCVGWIGLVGQEILQQIQDKPREESKLVGWYTACVPDFAWLKWIACFKLMLFHPFIGSIFSQLFLWKFSQPGDEDLICKDLFTCHLSI